MHIRKDRQIQNLGDCNEQGWEVYANLPFNSHQQPLLQFAFLTSHLAEAEFCSSWAHPGGTLPKISTATCLAPCQASSSSGRQISRTTSSTNPDWASTGTETWKPACFAWLGVSLEEFHMAPKYNSTAIFILFKCFRTLHLTEDNRLENCLYKMQEVVAVFPGMWHSSTLGWHSCHLPGSTAASLCLSPAPGCWVTEPSTRGRAAPHATPAHCVLTSLLRRCSFKHLLRSQCISRHLEYFDAEGWVLAVFWWLKVRKVKLSGSWTRWSLKVPSNWTILLYSTLLCSALLRSTPLHSALLHSAPLCSALSYPNFLLKFYPKTDISKIESEFRPQMPY